MHVKVGHRLNLNCERRHRVKANAFLALNGREQNGRLDLRPAEKNAKGRSGGKKAASGGPT
jgi:hypothetical protein